MNARVFAQSLFTFLSQWLYSPMSEISGPPFLHISQFGPLKLFQIQTRVWKYVETSLTELGEAGSFTPACMLASVNALVHYLAGSLFLFPWATNQSSNLSQWCRHWHWITQVLLLQNRKERAQWLKITPSILLLPRQDAEWQQCPSLMAARVNQSILRRCYQNEVRSKGSASLSSSVTKKRACTSRYHSDILHLCIWCYSIQIVPPWHELFSELPQ